MSRLVLTPEADAEVKRNLWLGFGLIIGPVLLFLMLLAAVINPPGSTEGVRIAWLLLLFLCLPVLAMAGSCLVLAYPMGCWPGFLRGKQLAALYGIVAEDVSNRSMRRWTKRAAFWKSFARGAGVTFLFVLPWFLITWATSRKGFPEGIVFPALGLMAFLGGVSSKAWVVRELVAEDPRVGGPP